MFYILAAKLPGIIRILLIMKLITGLIIHFPLKWLNLGTGVDQSSIPTIFQGVLHLLIRE